MFNTWWRYSVAWLRTQSWTARCLYFLSLSLMFYTSFSLFNLFHLTALCLHAHKWKKGNPLVAKFADVCFMFQVCALYDKADVCLRGFWASNGPTSPARRVEVKRREATRDNSSMDYNTLLAVNLCNSSSIYFENSKLS